MRKKIWLFLIPALLLAGCGKTVNHHTDARDSSRETQEAAEPAQKEIFAMDTYMTLTAYGERGQEAVDAAAEEIARIEDLVSTGKEDSEISVINREGSGKASADTWELLSKSAELYEATGGLFDITIYPVMKAWGFTSGDFRVPGKKELERLISDMGADKVLLNEKERTVSAEKRAEIDLGGIAKGYTSARVMEIFKEYGVTSGIVSLGGNVQTLGIKPDGSKWRVAVENPDKDGYAGVLAVEDQAVITSGGYERYFEEDGKTYHHIIDPRTGYPAESGLASVTVISDDGTLADGLSTSLFIMGKEKAEEFWRARSGEFDMVLVDDSGNIFVSEGSADAFESESKVEVIENN